MNYRTSILPLRQLQIWAIWTLSGLLSGALHAANASETFCQSVTDATKTDTCSHWFCESGKNERLSPICCSCWSMSHQWWWRPRCQECQATDMIGEQASFWERNQLCTSFFLFFIALLHISILFFSSCCCPQKDNILLIIRLSQSGKAWPWFSWLFLQAGFVSGRDCWLLLLPVFRWCQVQKIRKGRWQTCKKRKN